MKNSPFIIIRGAPGAGKSTFSHILQHRLPNGALIFETDNFFIDSCNHSDYHFDPTLLGIAHSWNLGEVMRACRDYPNVPIIVANTNSRKSEVNPYLAIAKKFKRPIFIITLLTKHSNIHSVPDSIVSKYRERIRTGWESEYKNDGIEGMYTIDNDEDVNAFLNFLCEKMNSPYSFSHRIQFHS